MRKVIIQGSARNDGNTASILKYLQAVLKADVIDLSQWHIQHYDYDYQNQDDDFLPLIDKIVANYDLLIFATPVYWYAMSGRMKVFFDRLTDCITIEKAVGRQLKGKAMALVSCGSEATLNEGFEVPFVKSAAYLGMSFAGKVHTWISSGEAHITKEVKTRLDEFVQSI